MSRISVLLLVVVMTAFLGACAQKQGTPAYMDDELSTAQRDCMEQASDMTNATVTHANASENAYFSMCMQTKYGYTWEQVQEMF